MKGVNDIKIVEVSESFSDQRKSESRPESASVTQFESDIDVITADFIEQLLDIQMEGFSIDDILDPGTFKMLRDDLLGILKTYGLEVEPVPDSDEDEFKFDFE